MQSVKIVASLFACRYRHAVGQMRPRRSIAEVKAMRSVEGPFGRIAMSQETSNATTRPPILIDLALQGGGSHGAFTWVVLDRLIEVALHQAR